MLKTMIPNFNKFTRAMSKGNTSNSKSEKAMSTPHRSPKFKEYLSTGGIAAKVIKLYGFKEKFEEHSRFFLFLRGVSLVRPAPAELPQVWKEARAGG